MLGAILREKGLKWCVSFIFLLCGNVFSETTRVESGITFEDFSFADTGRMEWGQVLFFPRPRYSVLGRITALHRFAETDTQGSVGGALPLGPRTGLEGEISFSPGALVAPKFSTSWFLYQGIKSVQIIPQYRFSHFDSADVHLVSAGAVWPLISSLEATLRIFAGHTTFKNGSSRWDPAYLAKAAYSLTSEIQIVPSYSFRRESFEAGAPGQAGSFKAHVVRVEALYQVQDGFFLRVAWEYESRSPFALVRRYDLGLQARW